MRRSSSLLCRWSVPMLQGYKACMPHPALRWAARNIHSPGVSAEVDDDDDPYLTDVAALAVADAREHHTSMEAAATPPLASFLSTKSASAICSSLHILRRGRRSSNNPVEFSQTISEFVHELNGTDGAWLTVESAALLVDCMALRNQLMVREELTGLHTVRFVLKTISDELNDASPPLASVPADVLRRRTTLLRTAHALITMNAVSPHSTDGGESHVDTAPLLLDHVVKLWWLVVRQLAEAAWEEPLTTADLGLACGVLSKTAVTLAMELASQSIALGAVGSAAIDSIGAAILVAINVPIPNETPSGDGAYARGMLPAMLSCFAFLSSPYVATALRLESESTLTGQIRRDFQAAALIAEHVLAHVMVLKSYQIALFVASLARLAHLGASPSHRRLMHFLLEERNGKPAIVSPRAISVLVDRLHAARYCMGKQDMLSFLPSYARLLVNLVNLTDNSPAPILEERRPRTEETACLPSVPVAPVTAGRFQKRRGIPTTPQQDICSASGSSPMPSGALDAGASAGSCLSQQDLAELEEETAVLLDSLATQCVLFTLPFAGSDVVEKYMSSMLLQQRLEKLWMRSKILAPNDFSRCVQSLETLGLTRYDLSARVAWCLEHYPPGFVSHSSVAHAFAALTRSPFGRDCAVYQRLFGAEASAGTQHWFAARAHAQKIDLGEGLIFPELQLSLSSLSNTDVKGDSPSPAVALTSDPPEVFSLEHAADILLSHCRVMPAGVCSVPLKVLWDLPTRLVARIRDCLHSLSVAPAESADADALEAGGRDKSVRAGPATRHVLTAATALSLLFLRISESVFPSRLLTLPLQALNSALMYLVHAAELEDALPSPKAGQLKIHRHVPPHLLLEAYIHISGLHTLVSTTDLEVRQRTSHALDQLRQDKDDAGQRLEERLRRLVCRLRQSLSEALTTRDEMYLRRMFMCATQSDEFYGKVTQEMSLLEKPVARAFAARLRQTSRMLSFTLLPFVAATAEAGDVTALVERAAIHLDRQCRSLTYLVLVLRPWCAADRLSPDGAVKLLRNNRLRQVVLKKLRVVVRPGQRAVPSDVVEMIEMFGFDDAIVSELAQLFKQCESAVPAPDMSVDADVSRYEVSLEQVARTLIAVSSNSQETRLKVLSALLPVIRHAAAGEWASLANAVTVLQFVSRNAPNEAKTIPLTVAGRLRRGAVHNMSLTEYSRVFTFFSNDGHQPEFMNDWREAFAREIRERRADEWFPLTQLLELIDATASASSTTLTRALYRSVRRKLLRVLTARSTKNHQACLGEPLLLDGPGHPADADILSVLQLRHWRAVVSASRNPPGPRLTGVEKERRFADSPAPVRQPFVGRPRDREQILAALTPEDLEVVQASIGDNDFLLLCQHVIREAPESKQCWRDACATTASRVLGSASQFLKACLNGDQWESSPTPLVDLQHWLDVEDGEGNGAVVMDCVPSNADADAVFLSLRNTLTLMAAMPACVATASATTGRLRLTGLGSACRWAFGVLFAASSADMHEGTAAVRALFGAAEMWCVWDPQIAARQVTAKDEVATAVVCLVTSLLAPSVVESAGEESELEQGARPQQQLTSSWVSQLAFPDALHIYTLLEATAGVLASPSTDPYCLSLLRKARAVFPDTDRRRDHDACGCAVTRESVVAGMQCLLDHLESLLSSADSSDVFLVVRSVAAASTHGDWSTRHDMRRFLAKVALVLTADVQRFVADCGRARVGELAELLAGLRCFSDRQMSVMRNAGFLDGERWK
jgi:hypothetical protein